MRAFQSFVNEGTPLVNCGRWIMGLVELVTANAGKLRQRVHGGCDEGKMF